MAAQRHGGLSFTRAVSAQAVQRHGVVLQHPAPVFGYQLLAAFDLGVVELFHLAAGGAHQVVVV